MAEYTYKDIIIDPTSEEAKNAIGKKCYMYDSPTMLLKMANSDDDARTLESIDESDYPFNDKEFGNEWTCIIVKKEEPKPRCIPFENGREFFNSYLSVESRLEKEDYFLSNHGIWLKAKDADDALFMVTEIWSYGVCVSGNMKTTNELEDFYLTINDATTWDELLNSYTFLDDSPCGKEVKDE